MPAGSRHAALIATIAFLIALLVPAGALASGGGKCNASACKIYTEGPGTAGGNNGQQNPPTSSGQHTIKPTHVPSRTSRLLSHAGKDRAILHHIISIPGYGAARGKVFQAGAASAAAPSALGAAFDLGAGPTVLLAILIATALALALHGGLRGWRQRRARS